MFIYIIYFLGFVLVSVVQNSEPQSKLDNLSLDLIKDILA